MPLFNTQKLMKAANYSSMVFTEQKLIVALDDGSFLDVLDADSSDISQANGAVIVKKDMYMPNFTLVKKDNLKMIFNANKNREVRAAEDGYNASLDIQAEPVHNVYEDVSVLRRG